MELKRPKLFEQLRSFVADGNGVLIGAPGVGKTFLLREYYQELFDSDTLCIYLSIDRLAANSETDLQTELGIPTDFITYLKSQEHKYNHSHPPVLIIDAFDAARSEYAQQFVLGLIRRVKVELAERWHLLISVRSYDARKSVALQDLFQVSTDHTSYISSEYQDGEIQCRHLVVPQLSDEEVERIITTVDGLESIYESAGNDFRELMRIPFNIWLAESLLQQTENQINLSTVSSENQLLTLFWEHRVIQAPQANDLLDILSHITEKMVEQRMLSARIQNVYQAGMSQAWDVLLSSGLLEEIPGRRRVVFSHNILFDYAVSELLIEREPTEACKFLAEDPSRPLFLRPSIDYFFTGLWDSSPEDFWNILWYMLEAPESHVRVYARLVPAMVIAREARTVDQLTPLLDRIRADDEISRVSLLHIFQAIRGLFSGQHDELWGEVARQASICLQNEFAWELAALTEDILGRTSEEDHNKLFTTCGEAGRRILEWALQTRTGSAGSFVDSVGALKGVPIVCRTFGSDVTESRQLLEKIIEQITDSQFPIQYLTQLTEELPYIWPTDSDFAINVYRKTFTHEEQSEDQTSFGTPILPLVSTRRQDYSMCQYRLIQYFEDFMNFSFVSAAHAAVCSLDNFIFQKHLMRYPNLDLAELTNKFEFVDLNATYIRDFSHIWESGSHHDQAITLAGQLFDRLEHMAKNNQEDEIDSFLTLLAEEANVAFWWKRLLETGSRVPSIFASRLFPLASALPILQHAETLHAVGMFIEECACHLTADQRRELETKILDLAVSNSDNDTDIRHRDRLLSCFPRSLLSTDEARQILSKLESLDAVPPNEPLVHISSWSEPYDEGEWLADQGVDAASESNRALLDVTKPADEFSSFWQNKRPTEDAIANFIPDLKAAYSFTQKTTTADAETVQLAWTRLVAGVTTIARGLSSLENDTFSLYKEILINSLHFDSPFRETDRPDELYTFASWSPNPTTEAVRGLPWLARLRADKDILDTLERYTKYSNPSVRFLAILDSFRLINTAPDAFWRIAQERAVNEPSPAVQDALCRAIGFAWIADRARAVSILSVITDRIFKPHQESDAIKTLTSLALQLTLGHDRDEWGISFTNKILQNPLGFSHALAHAVFETTNHLSPVYVGPPNDHLLIACIDWLSEAIQAAHNGLQEIQPQSRSVPDDNTTELIKRLYGISDHVVLKLHLSFKSETADGNNVLTGSQNQRCEYYTRVMPLLEKIVEFANDANHGMLFPRTAHYFMQFLTEAVAYDPRGTLHLAAAVVAASESSGYTLDSMAARETVQLAEHIVADYRSELKDRDVLNDLVSLLDLFAKVGWPDALKLLWSLDEVFR